MLGTVKIDKLCFGLGACTPEIAEKIDTIIYRFYGNVIKSDKVERYAKLYRHVTPTKQLRTNDKGYEHNLQMVPIDQFLLFLKELRQVAELQIYEMHLAKDVLLKNETYTYLETLLNHEYLNGYVASKTEANSFNTVYVAKKKNLSSKHKQKLKIKFYDKAGELISRNEANRVLPLKEPVNIPELPIDYSTGKDRYGILLYKMNLLRCELELRENYLPYTTISEMIEAIENNTLQNTLEEKYNSILSSTVFAEPKKKPSCKSLKELAINLMNDSDRNYKTLFDNAGMSREYNYFKRAKEVVSRQEDLNFEELREKLVR